MRRMVRNRIRCKLCGDILESTSVHDFKRCSCGKCFTDGGLDYARRGFDGDNPDDIFEDLSVYEELTEESKDDEPRKPIRGRYNFTTGEPIAEYYE